MAGVRQNSLHDGSGASDVRILVVEDDRKPTQVFREGLKENGFGVDAAGDGEAPTAITWSAPPVNSTFFGAELVSGPAARGACADRQHRRHGRRSRGSAIASLLLLMGPPARGASPRFSRPRLRGKLPRMKHTEKRSLP
jgi:hypothetical protein